MLRNVALGRCERDARTNSRVKRVGPKKAALAHGAVIIAEENQHPCLIWLEREMTAKKNDGQRLEEQTADDEHREAMCVGGDDDPSDEKGDSAEEKDEIDDEHQPAIGGGAPQFLAGGGDRSGSGHKERDG